MTAMIPFSVALERGLQAAAVISLVWLAYKISVYGRREKDLPPGPPTTFGVGNLLLVPPRAAYLKFAEWAREYGEIYSLKVLHDTLIVLNGPAAVQHVMEKGNGYTQGRPARWLINDYVYGDDHLLFTDVPTRVASFRRAYTAMMNPKMSLNHVPIQEAESSQLLYDILSNPKDFFTSIKRFTFSSMMSVAYGVRTPRWETPAVTTFYEYTETLVYLISVGATPPLDLIPILKLIPKRFAPWMKLADTIRYKERKLTAELLQVVRDRIANDSRNGAFMEEAIDKQAEFGFDDDMLQMFGAIALSGGSDTTACYLLSAVLLLVGQTEVQARAQEELDRVVGPHRTPALADIQNLPYLRAIVKEVERLRPVLALGAPHRATADQVYAGYRIPKDATVICNTWAMGHDPNLFEDPERFWPDRFMHDEESAEDLKAEKSPTYAFGNGRRVCPGSSVAKNTLHIVLPRLLWGFDILNATDSSNGDLIKVDTMDYAEGLLLCPNKFACDFRVRSATHAETIRSEWRDAIPQLKLFEVGLSPEDEAFVAKQRQG